MTQLSLFEERKQRSLSDDVERTVVSLMHTYSEWVTAATLSQMTGFNIRRLREVANASQGRIISGQKGYCLLKRANPDEIRHAANWLESQGREMIKRAERIRKLAHKLI
jgi:hypothetical protein